MKKTKKVMYIETYSLNILIGVKTTVFITDKKIVELVETNKLNKNDEVLIGIYVDKINLKKGIICKVEDLKIENKDTVKLNLEGISIGKILKEEKPKLYEIIEVEEVIKKYKKNAKKSDYNKLKTVLFNASTQIFHNNIPTNSFDNLEDENLLKYTVLLLKLSSEEIETILLIDDYLSLINFVFEKIANLSLEINLDKEIDDKVKARIDKEQKEYLLRKKLETIQNEMNENSVENIDEYTKKINKLKLPAKLKEKLEKEINKLNKMPEFATEASVIRGYLDIVLDLPWNKFDKTKVDINLAKKVLDNEHYAMNEPKDNVIDYLAYIQNELTNKSNEDKRPTILCLVGPPGVGKTSFAESIAHSINRKFARIALGGVSDESEIRGHRRTYVGAMPGRIIDAIKRTKTSNPVLLLDEIDKLSYQYKGDPSSALLEVLDPEQNKTFEDRFIDYPFDLSNVFFICTANDASKIPAPLYDRMEIIYLDSYTDIEKVQITKKYIIPELEKNMGLNIQNLTDEDIKYIINSYTREAGVRNLKRQFEKIFKKILRKQIEDGKQNKIFKITRKKIKEFLGVEKYKKDKLKNTLPKIGNVIGLAWTSVGGVAMEVQGVKLNGKGKLILTGTLGDVMKESAQVSHSYIRSIASKHKIEEDFYEKYDIHLHFPEGATPKDGPSAGITITTAMLSILTNKKVKQNVAMTGEITINGDVLAIGGVKEKLIGAINIGATDVILPFDNKVDVEEINDDIKSQLNIHFVKNYKDVEKIVFDK